MILAKRPELSNARYACRFVFFACFVDNFHDLSIKWKNAR